ncbi:MAG TPA: hypothetical protein VD704_06530 [Gaiellaceae bacterium]|nr:hypothetical protein [Gaiellaceae bacterium]
MTASKDSEQSRLALLAALARNRGELDAATLQRLLRLVDPARPAQ